MYLKRSNSIHPPYLQYPIERAIVLEKNNCTRMWIIKKITEFKSDESTHGI